MTLELDAASTFEVPTLPPSQCESLRHEKAFEAEIPPPPELQTGGFSSVHNGGSQFALADGSVRFVSENIDPELYRDLGNREDRRNIGDF